MILGGVMGGIFIMKQQKIKKKADTFCESFDNARITKSRQDNEREIDLYLKRCSSQFDNSKRLALRAN